MYMTTATMAMAAPKRMPPPTTAFVSAISASLFGGFNSDLLVVDDADDQDPYYEEESRHDRYLQTVKLKSLHPSPIPIRCKPKPHLI
jgi:hypothetical protein